MSVDFCYKLILINKFIKHDRVNSLFCYIKYLDLYLSSIFIFIYFSIKLSCLQDLGRVIDMQSRHILCLGHEFHVLAQFCSR